MKKVIGLTGYKKNGKTTAADYIKQKYLTESETPVQVERINFKDCLIDEVKENFPGSLEFISAMYEMEIDTLFKEKPGGMRKLMQDVGLARRKEDPMYWVDRWEKKVKESNSDVIITDDVRFLNEYDAIGRHNGIVLKIVKEGQINDDFHATETEIGMIPCPEIRAKDKEELFNQLDQIIL
jgi:hypothetical protein